MHPRILAVLERQKALADGEARSRAVTDFDTNLVVTAGAGTGKTSLLVERTCTWIVGRDAPLHRLAAITFTEKAAAEMAERLSAALHRLRGLATGSTPLDLLTEEREADRAYAWLAGEMELGDRTIAERTDRALDDLYRASISTFHSFCADLLRRHPRAAGVDPDFSVDAGFGRREAFEEAWPEHLERALAGDAPDRDRWLRVLNALTMTEITDLARSLVGHGLPRSADPLPFPPPEELLGEAARRCRADIDAVLAAATGLRDNQRRYLEVGREVLGSFLEEGVEGLRRTAATVEMPTSKPYLERAEGFSAGSDLEGVPEERVEAVGKAALRLAKAIDATDDAVVADVVALVAPFARRLDEELLRRGQVTYQGLLRLSRDILRSDRKVRETEKERWEGLLVDEFQDTDPLQYEIVFLLAEEPDGAAADPYEAALAPGRLFIVGDPKQSIYRFRGADIVAYRRARERIVESGGENLELRVSFRCDESLTRPFNRLFPSAFRQRAGDRPEAVDPEEVQAEFAPLAPRPGGEVSGPPEVPPTEVWRLECEGSAEDRRRREAEVVAAWIDSVVGPEEGRDGHRYRDVAILMRATSDLGLYLRPLRSRGIPFTVDGGKTFYDRPEVIELRNLLRALAEPNDRVSLLAVCRGPWGACSDAELQAYAGSGNWSYHVAEPPDPGRFPGPARVFRRLRRLRRRILRLPTDAALRRVLEETSLASLHAAAPEGAQRAANLEKLVERVALLSRQRGLGFPAALRQLELEATDEPAAESALADPSVDAVRVMTIHKAKGLEFPVVVVPDLRRGIGGGGPDAPAATGRWVTGWDGVADADGALAVRARGASNGVEAWAGLADEQHARSEEMRLFYVACTRARERLILVDTGDRSGANDAWVEALGAWEDSSEAAGDRGFDPDEAGPAEWAGCDGLVRFRRGRPEELSAAFDAIPRGDSGPSADTGHWVEAVRRFESARDRATARGRSLSISPTGLRERQEDSDAEDAEEAVAVGGAPTDDAGTSPGEAAGAPDGEVARIAGDVFHRVASEWNGGEEAFRRAVVELRSAPWGHADAVPGMGEQLEAAVASLVDDFFDSPLAERWRCLDPRFPELPVLFPHDLGGTETRSPAATTGTGRPVPAMHGFIDLLARDEEGWLVIDYKTGPVGDDVDAAAVPYRQQLAVYAEGVRRALGLDDLPRCEIWFVRPGRAAVLAPETLHEALEALG